MQRLNFVTEDRLTVEVGLELGIKLGLITKDENDKFVCCHHDIDRVIQYGVKNGFFKPHFEFGEPYYHTTQAGIDLLDSRIQDQNEN